MEVLLAGDAAGGLTVAGFDADRTSLDEGPLGSDGVQALETEHPRWVVADVDRTLPPLLAEGVRLSRAHDLRLVRAILRGTTADDPDARTALPGDGWDRPPVAESTGLFALGSVEAPPSLAELEREYARQTAMIDRAAAPARLRLLAAAESVGALAAAEMRHAGLPWNAERHDAILRAALGPRPLPGARPARIEEALDEVRRALGAPELEPESPGQLLRALQHAGIRATSTRAWELRGIEHPAIPPLLRYKKLQRLLVANGWHWLDEWVHGGRFRPSFVVGGVVTGRWASEGGGALQLPKQVRAAVVADPGWKLVVADAAQLEPRVLAAMSGDARMAEAGRSADLYEGIVSTGAVADRREAKYGMLGAIYGGTTGVSGRVLPRLHRVFPEAMALVEDAARAGERGERVRTWLGRTSPARGGAAWDETMSDAELRRERSDSRSWGRFTRNFVVQGTAAEWALCWMGAVRAALWELGEGGASGGAPAPFERRPHLVFFLHDELVVHAPAELAEQCERILRVAAGHAGRMLFGESGVEWALDTAIVDDYGEAE